MNTLSARISRRIQMTVTSFRSDCQFSLWYALLRIADELGGRLHFRKLSSWAHQKRDTWILSYLCQRLVHVLDAYRTDFDPGVKSLCAPIWICWWTGEKTAPDLVKQCIQSIRKNANGHPVHIIDQTTYAEFIHIPDYIINKAENGQIGLAHLADYIRVSLLEEYGGLWLDATIFCSGPIPEEYFNYPFFTCKSPTQSCGYVSMMRWTTFTLGGWKENVIYRFLKACFECYWQFAPCAIDYLFFDYLIALAHDTLPAVHQLMAQVPENNLCRDDLAAAMNRAAPASEWDQIVQPDTVLYKLSWRESYALTAEDGSPSVYSHFINEPI